MPYGTRVKRKKLRRKIVFFFALFLIILAVATYGTYLYVKAGSIFSDSYEDDGKHKSDLRETEVDPKVDDVSILVMGVDGSESRGNQDDGLTDALMLATLNKEDHNVKLLSIPRDSYVQLPKTEEQTKINEAYAHGGSSNTVDTVEHLLDIPVDYYVKVNFDALMDVVDAADGVDVDVPYEMYEQDSKDHADAIHLQSGKQQLDGEEALAFARTRKQDDDMERGKRQQEVIEAIMEKTTSMDSILNYNDIMEAVGKNMTTNMTFDEMKSFFSYGTKKDIQLDSLTLDGEDYQPGNKYFYQLDQKALKETQKTLKKQLGLKNTKPNIDDDILPDTEDVPEEGEENPGYDPYQEDEDGEEQEEGSPDYDPNQEEENGEEQGEENPDYDPNQEEENGEEQGVEDPDYNPSQEEENDEEQEIEGPDYDPNLEE